MPQREDEHHQTDAIVETADQRRARDNRQCRKRCGERQREHKIYNARC